MPSEPPADSAASRAPQGTATRLLHDLTGGRAEAADELLPLVYDELRALAGAFFRRERPEHTLQPTALVAEAWMRLAGDAQPAYEGRRHFMAIAGTVMRRVLVEHARARDAAKRGGDWQRVTLSEPWSGAPPGGLALDDTLALHEAIERLAALSPRQAEIVELRWFAGLTVPEIADHLGLVTRTVEKDWTMARAWLARELGTPS